MGGTITLRLSEAESNHVFVEISHESGQTELFGIEINGAHVNSSLLVESHPQFILSQRTVQRCGGRLMLKCDHETHRAFHIILPRDPLAAQSKTEKRP